MYTANDNIVEYGTVSSSNAPTVPTPSSIADNTPRIFSRQLLSGSMRGNQNITGTISVTSANTNKQTVVIDGVSGQINIAADASGNTSSVISQGMSITGASNSITMGISSTNNQAQLLFNDGTTNRLLIGQNSSGSEVVWISKAGAEVTTASASDLIFNSAQDIFKIISKVQTTIPSFTIGTGKQNFSLVTVAHGQSTIPIVNVYVQSYMLNSSTFALISSSYTPVPISSRTQGDPTFQNVAGGTYYSNVSINFAVDATYVYIQAFYSGSSTDTLAAIPVTYFVLQETAT